MADGPGENAEGIVSEKFVLEYRVQLCTPILLTLYKYPYSVLILQVKISLLLVSPFFFVVVVVVLLEALG